MVPAVLDRLRRAFEESLKAPLAIEQRSARHVPPVEEEQIEGEVDQAAGTPRIGRGLELGEGRRAVGPYCTQLPIQIGSSRP